MKPIKANILVLLCIIIRV